MGKKQVIFLIIGILLIGAGIGYNRLFVSGLEATHDKLIAEYYDKVNVYDSKKSSLEMQSTSTQNSVTAVSDEKMKADAKKIKKYLTPAFSYKSEDEFIKNKDAMQNKISSDFVKKIMPQPKFANVKTKPFRSISGVKLYPKKLSGGTYIYQVVVSYYIYSDEADLENKDALEKNYALVDLVCDNNNKVSDVVAKSIFTNIVEQK